MGLCLKTISKNKILFLLLNQYTFTCLMNEGFREFYHKPVYRCVHSPFRVVTLSKCWSILTSLMTSVAQKSDISIFTAGDMYGLPQFSLVPALFYIETML